jgi:hypothetical protein
MKHGPDIDPLLTAQLARAATGGRVEALLLLRGEARASLAAAAASEHPAGTQALPAFVRTALGPTAASSVDCRLFPALGAVYVAGPVEFMRRLLSAPEIASATLPDASE